MAAKTKAKEKRPVFQPCMGGFQALFDGGGVRLLNRGTEDEPDIEVLSGQSLCGNLVWENAGKRFSDGADAVEFATELLDRLRSKAN